MTKCVYIIGALRNQAIPDIANAIESRTGYEAFADWFAPGPDADDYLREYSKARGRNYRQILESPAARHPFEFDKKHLDRADAAVLVLPSGRSCHLEAGYVVGRGKPVFVYCPGDAPERVDIMYNFCRGFITDLEELCHSLTEAVEPTCGDIKFQVSYWPRGLTP